MSTSPSAAIAAVPAAASTQNVWLAIYVAMLVGKFSEWVPGFANVPLAKIAIVFTALFAWRARSAFAPVRVRSLQIARPAVAFLALAVISITFSVYRSESLSDLYGIVVYLFSFVLLVKITQTPRDVERLLVAVCVAAAGLSIAVLLTYNGGRARINQNFDSNDLAYGLVTAFPIIRVLAVTAVKRKLLLHGLSVAVIIALLLTGSRGGAIGFGVVMLLLVAFPLGFAETGRLKGFRLGRFVAVLGLIGVLGVTLWGYLPAESRAQMATLLHLKDDYNASESNNGRMAIWIRDSAAVWRRPIGYGLGSSEYVNGMTGGLYRSPHNSFVQAFVELGVPGLLLFCASYLVTLKQLGRVSGLGRHAAPEGESARACLYARALRIALAGNLVAGFFLSQAYAGLLWTLVAICAAQVRISLPPTDLPAAVAART